MDADLQRRQCEKTIREGNADFTGMYMTVDRMNSLSEGHACIFTEDSVALLTSLLDDRCLARNRQSLFLFRKAADTLSALVTGARKTPLSENAFQALNRGLRMPRGPARRAVAEALGGLPWEVKGPRFDAAPFRQIPIVRMDELFEAWDLRPEGSPVTLGRSLVFPTARGRVIVLKLAHATEPSAAIAREPRWMELLRGMTLPGTARFDIPRPLSLNGSCVFRVTPPVRPGAGTPIPVEGRPAVAFVAPADYFRYPNDPRPARRLPWGDFLETLCRNAGLLGALASQGIVHTAPIPLFHNRIQQDRRRDGGRYDWTLGGRLDRWIASCAFPNIGPTGIRDFEHFKSVRGRGGSLYRPVGDHLLSLLLLTGSRFRSRDASRMGMDEQGRPVDARDLFHAGRLGRAVEGLCRSYYRGFTGTPLSEPLPFDPAGLIDRMIEEMGVDRHMDEILRAADQEAMGDDAFRGFLAERGVPPERVRRWRRGAEDISIPSGPHLGAFNQRISLPELLDAVEGMTSICLAGRYRAACSGRP